MKDSYNLVILLDTVTVPRINHPDPDRLDLIVQKH